jgi:asparagine synthase (glutamine-hydrolysing)
MQLPETTFLSLDKLHSFTIGLKPPVDVPAQQTSPDILCAREVAKFIGTIHHEFEYTFQEGLDAISDVIRALETYDVTTIRAGTPMFLLARRIKAMGIKMILSGEGADEIFGGYLCKYFSQF